jgi:hypothetical protein
LSHLLEERGWALHNLPSSEAVCDGPRRVAVVAITNGKLDLGPWEQIFNGEFDRRRRKRVLVKIIGE